MSNSIFKFVQINMKHLLYNLHIYKIHTLMTDILKYFIYLQVKNQVPKICDLGFARPELFMSGTFVGTISHMAPEVIEQKHYDSTADIYSLGILLWELWYGRHAYSEETYNEYKFPRLFELIKSGHRPLLHYKYCQVDPLQQLLNQCWTAQSSERPSAAKVKDTLKEIFEDLHHQAPTSDAQMLYDRLSTTSLLY